MNVLGRKAESLTKISKNGLLNPFTGKENEAEDKKVYIPSRHW